MRRLVTELRGDKNAREGLRKAVVDHIGNRFIGNTEAATSGQTLIKSDQFQSFMRQNKAALRLVFSDAEMQSLTAIAEDLQRANRSIAAVKLPGGSNTVQDALAVDKSGGGSMLNRIAQAAAASGGFMASGGWGALGAWLGARAVMQMRQAGVQKVDDLIRDAMLDPGLARILLSKTPFKPDKGPASALGTRWITPLQLTVNI